MSYLLPNRFKKMGSVMAPSGLCLWLLMQLGYTKRALVFLFGETAHASPYHITNAVIAILSFFSFLAGICFIIFSREKVEDEMIQRTRLDSFQFAAMVQITCIIIGFLTMLLYKEPGDTGLMLFFIALIFLFWLSFIARFHYIIHIRLRK